MDNVQVSEAIIVSQDYDGLGRISKNNVGNYNYKTTTKPFQNTSVDLNQQYNEYFSSRSNLDISYNVHKSPIDIIAEGNDKISFIYNINNSRSTMYYGSLENDKMSRPFRKHYSADGSMEIKRDLGNDTTEFIFYIGGDAYSAPIILKSDGTTQNYVYLHRDYLGSILAITSEAGAIIEKRHFDAWGNIANVADGQNNELDKLTFFDRGYTGHEHLQGVVLIHMNGRLYDPKVHRFLQPDNYVQDPLNTQNYNRYGYCLNNPLKFTNPTGENWWDRNWKSVVTAVAAVATAVVIVLSLGTATPLVVALWAGAGAGFVGGAVGTALNGGNFGESLVAGLVGAAAGAFFGVGGAYISAAIGAIGIVPGALSGAFTSSTLGALSNLMAGRPWDENIALNATFSTIGGGISGLSAAKASGSGRWFGTASKPTPSVLAESLNKSTAEAQAAYQKSLTSQAEPTKIATTATQDQVAGFAKENNYFSGQKSLGNKSIVEGYLNKMNEGTFDTRSGAAGFEFKGKTIFTDGNHRMNAAIQFKLNTGSSQYINLLKLNGNFTEANPALYGYKTFSFPILK